MPVTRRKLLIGGAALSSAAIFGGGILFNLDASASPLPEDIPPSERPQELAYLAPFVCRPEKWDAGHLFAFINSVQDHHLDPYGESLELKDFHRKSRPQKLEAIHKEVLWQSSSIFTYPLKSIENINYHELVTWCASHTGIPGNEARFTSTFDLERGIMIKLFIDTWDKISEGQRLEFLDNIGASKEVDSKAVAGMSGAAAIGVLSATVYFAGFTFYTTMSVFIASVAGWLGVTLPFAAYMTASSTVSIMAGPIGWALGAVLLAGSIAAWAGSANVRKTTTTVLQLHAMKAGALYGNGGL